MSLFIHQASVVKKRDFQTPQFKHSLNINIKYFLSKSDEIHAIAKRDLRSTALIPRKVKLTKL